MRILLLFVVFLVCAAPRAKYVQISSVCIEHLTGDTIVIADLDIPVNYATSETRAILDASERDVRYLKKQLKPLFSYRRARSIEDVYKLTHFVQTLHTDTVGNGRFKHPYETLLDGAGDCNDKALLLYALLRSYYINARLFAMPRHVAVGVACDGCEGFFLEDNGVKYYYLEATSFGHTLGKLPRAIQGRKDSITIFY